MCTGSPGETVTPQSDLELTPCLVRPGYEHLSALASHVRQGHTTHPAARGRANPGHLPQRLPEAFAINTECFHAFSFLRLLSVCCASSLLHQLPHLSASRTAFASPRQTGGAMCSTQYLSAARGCRHSRQCAPRPCAGWPV